LLTLWPYWICFLFTDFFLLGFGLTKVNVPVGSGPGIRSIPSSSSPGATCIALASRISVSVRQTRPLDKLRLVELARRA
jgi:hypothetical protein